MKAESSTAVPAAQGRRRAGAIMLQALIIAVVLISIVTAVIRWQLHRHQAISKQSNQAQLEGEVAGGNAMVNQCLAAAGYPSGTCAPNAAQSACVPAGMTLAFSGTPPSCEIKISLTK